MMIVPVAVLSLLLSSVVAVSPSGDYAPSQVQCPANYGTFIREANSLSEKEVEYLKYRKEVTNNALIEYLERVGLEDVQHYKRNGTLDATVALAFPGGGHRAMLTGAGFIAGLDNRTEGTNISLAGVLQSSSYVSALSGGSWLLGTLLFQNWKSVYDNVFDGTNETWDLSWGHQLFTDLQSVLLVIQISLKKFTFLQKLSFLWNLTGYDVYDAIKEKENAGFDISITDVWGRFISHFTFPLENDYLEDSLWTDIQTIDSFKTHQMPFPLVVALGRQPGSLVYNLESTVVEFNPFEMGSFDPSLNAFTNLKYIGSQVTNGVTNGTCVAGYDNAGFIIGTSSSLFNQYLDTLVCDACTGLPTVLKAVVKPILQKLSAETEDIATYTPNPFFKSEYSRSENLANNDTLYLIDGGIGGEIIPLNSLANIYRKPDVLFAFDSSRDTKGGWPNGTALVNTYERQFADQGNATVFPYVPSAQNFLRQNLTAKPVFFGCEGKNLTGLVKNDVTPPIVVYIASRPFLFFTNTSTYKLEYSESEKLGMIQNSIEVVSRLNGTLDSDWDKCIGCAMIRRQQERDGVQPSETCRKCFDNYCWDGTVLPNDDNYVSPDNFDLEGLVAGLMSLPLVA